MNKKLMEYANELFTVSEKALTKGIKISDDLLDAIKEMQEQAECLQIEKLLTELSFDSCKYLSKLLVKIADKYQMKESTDIDFINFVLSLEQEIEDRG